MNRWKQIATVLGIACVPIVSVGARLRGTHAHFDEWFSYVAQSYQGDPGLGLGIGTWWIFVLFVTSITAAVLIVMLYGMCWLATKTNLWRGAAIGISSVICVFACTTLSFSLRKNIQWGFYPLASGELLAGLAVICGYIAVWSEKQNKPSHRNAESRAMRVFQRPVRAHVRHHQSATACLESYASDNELPVNAPLEIRVQETGGCLLFNETWRFR